MSASLVEVILNLDFRNAVADKIRSGTPLSLSEQAAVDVAAAVLRAEQMADAAHTNSLVKEMRNSRKDL